jgi:OOP family OmpA-OmpF porin
MPAPIGYRRRILAIGLIAAGALYSFGAPWYVNNIEDDLEQRVPDELAAAGFTGVTATFDGQDGTLQCAQPLDDPEQATEEAYDVWGVHAITLDRSCRVNKAPATGESESGSAVESSIESSGPVVQAVAGTAAGGAIAYATIGDLIDADPRLSYFSMLLHEAGLTDVVRVAGPITVFAPTDEAFDKLSADTNARLSSDPALLSQLLGHHIAEGSYAADQLTAKPIVMVDGDVLDVQTDGTTTIVDGVPIADPDVPAGNGVVHVVNDLLNPGELDLVGTVAP